MGVGRGGKFLVRAGLVLGIGIALSACAAGPGDSYATGYYGYPDYYDYGYLDSFGFVGRDRDHDPRHDHDGGNAPGEADPDHAAPSGPRTLGSPALGGPPPAS